MNRAIYLALRSIERVSLVTGSISALAVFVVTLIISYEVVLRFLFRKPTVWVHEVSGYTLLFIVMMGAAYTLYADRHVRMDLLYVRLPLRMRAWAKLATYALALVVYFAVMFYMGWGMFWEALRLGNRESFGMLRTPLALTYWLIPAGALLISLQLLHQIYFAALSLRRGRELTKTADLGREEA
ncbi:MAG: TRAP transporter small permease [Chloroflexota bacterium]